MLVASATANLGLGVWAVVHSDSIAAGTSERDSRSVDAAAGEATARSGIAGASTLDWRSVESTDYRQYVRNLRAIGCPEQTIFDIIVADVNMLFARRSSAPDGASLGYWQSRRGVSSRDEARRVRLRRELEDERRELLRDLLGPQALERLDAYTARGSELEDPERFAFLGPEKRAELEALEARFGAIELAARERDYRGVVTASAERALAELSVRRRRAIEALLTEQELFELDVRTSPTAVRLREQLDGFGPSEQEFRDLYRSRAEYERGLLATQDVRDPDVIEERIAIEERLVSEARRALGETRYQDYERARDVDYQTLRRLAEHFELPARSATDVHSIKARVEGEVRRIDADPALAAAERDAALARLQLETERALQTILGREALGAYRQDNRWWLFFE